MHKVSSHNATHINMKDLNQEISNTFQVTYKQSPEKVIEISDFGAFSLACIKEIKCVLIFLIEFMHHRNHFSVLEFNILLLSYLVSLNS